MRYQYYGTAAAEGIPALWCDCKVCQTARKKGGRNIRSRSQQTIDDTLLIDFPADTFWHTAMGLPLYRLHTCIVTHDHQDHFYPEDLKMRLGYYAQVKDETPFCIYAMKPVINHFNELMSAEKEQMTPHRIQMHEITKFQTFEAEGYQITPLNADHDHASGCVIFLIEKDGKCVLHANDTGYFPQDTWDFLKTCGKRIDFATFDCTEPGKYLDEDKNGWHMNYLTVKNVRKQLKELGCIDEHTICVINHFSHNGLYTYDELCELAENDGFLVSYDGMAVEF